MLKLWRITDLFYYFFAAYRWLSHFFYVLLYLKYNRNGNVVIVKNGIEYNAVGQKL